MKITQEILNISGHIPTTLHQTSREIKDRWKISYEWSYCPLVNACITNWKDPPFLLAKSTNFRLGHGFNVANCKRLPEANRKIAYKWTKFTFQTV